MDRIEALMMVKEECDKHPYHCEVCALYDYDDECLVERVPCQWDVEKIEKALERMEKK